MRRNIDLFTRALDARSLRLPALICLLALACLPVARSQPARTLSNPDSIAQVLTQIRQNQVRGGNNAQLQAIRKLYLSGKVKDAAMAMEEWQRTRILNSEALELWYKMLQDLDRKAEASRALRIGIETYPKSLRLLRLRAFEQLDSCLAAAPCVKDWKDYPLAIREELSSIQKHESDPIASLMHFEAALWLYPEGLNPDVRSVLLWQEHMQLLFGAGDDTGLQASWMAKADSTDARRYGRALFDAMRLSTEVLADSVRALPRIVGMQKATLRLFAQNSGLQSLRQAHLIDLHVLDQAGHLEPTMMWRYAWVDQDYFAYYLSRHYMEVQEAHQYIAEQWAQDVALFESRMQQVRQ